MHRLCCLFKLILFTTISSYGFMAPTVGACIEQVIFTANIHVCDKTICALHYVQHSHDKATATKTGLAFFQISSHMILHLMHILPTHYSPVMKLYVLSTGSRTHNVEASIGAGLARDFTSPHTWSYISCTYSLLTRDEALCAVNRVQHPHVRRASTWSKFQAVLFPEHSVLRDVLRRHTHCSVYVFVFVSYLYVYACVCMSMCMCVRVNMWTLWTPALHAKKRGAVLNSTAQLHVSMEQQRHWKKSTESTSLVCTVQEHTRTRKGAAYQCLHHKKHKPDQMERRPQGHDDTPLQPHKHQIRHIKLLIHIRNVWDCDQRGKSVAQIVVVHWSPNLMDAGIQVWLPFSRLCIE